MSLEYFLAEREGLAVLSFRGFKTRGIHFFVTGLADTLLHNVVQAGLLDAANSRAALPQALLVPFLEMNGYVTTTHAQPGHTAAAGCQVS